MSILACFVFILIHHSASISFNLTNISPDHKDKLRLEGGAYISGDGVQVTPENKPGTGRVTYAERLHLWDKNSRGLASFSTSFSFIKLSDPNSHFRQDDGFIFFLAQNSYVIQGDMGSNQYVWVEFDPYCNGWDKNDSICDHVGININSESSITQLQSFNNISSGRESRVWVNYDSVSKNLSVSFTSFQNNTSLQQDGLVHNVDLREEFPEWVVLGFSASRGAITDQNTVKSWVFNSSNLQVDHENNGLGAKKLVLLVGLTVGSWVSLLT